MSNLKKDWPVLIFFIWMGLIMAFSLFSMFVPIIFQEQKETGIKLILIPLLLFGHIPGLSIAMFFIVTPCVRIVVA